MKVALSDKYLKPLKQYEQRAICTADDWEKEKLARKCFKLKLCVTDPLSPILKKNRTLDAQQFIGDCLDRFYNVFADVFQNLSIKDTDKTVLFAKNELQKDYGVKKVFLDNNPMFARRCLETVELLSNNSISLPERIIGCRYYPKYCGISMKNTKDGSTILLHSDLEGWQPNSVTNSPIELPLHESLHLQQNGFFLSNIKTLPQEYRSLAKKSKIANSSINCHCNHEAHVDLLVRKLIMNDLTEDEEKLLKYLNELFYTEINIPPKQEKIEIFDEFDLLPF